MTFRIFVEAVPGCFSPIGTISGDAAGGDSAVHDEPSALRFAKILCRPVRELLNGTRACRAIAWPPVEPVDQEWVRRHVGALVSRVPATHEPELIRKAS